MLKSFNTPLKRFGLIVLSIGLFCLVIGIMQKSFLRTFPVRIERVLIESISLQDNANGFSLFVFYGFYLSVLGVLLSVFYDKTVGRVINWIFNGN